MLFLLLGSIACLTLRLSWIPVVTLVAAFLISIVPKFDFPLWAFALLCSACALCSAGLHAPLRILGLFFAFFPQDPGLADYAPITALALLQVYLACYLFWTWLFRRWRPYLFAKWNELRS